jgi:hypothetical protein
MAKIGELARKRYMEVIKEYKGASAALLEEERKAAEGLVKGDLGQTAVRLMLADKSLNLVSQYSLMNSLSWVLLNIKNENFLNDARKACYKAIIYLEGIVTNCVDCAFGDYEDAVAAIDTVLGDREKHQLLRKLGFSIAGVKEGFGSNSKWKWSFVEIEGRFAVVVKNLINFKNLISKLDPAYPNYDSVLGHVALAQKTLADSADAYRQKYELSTRRHDDMQLAIAFLSALRRVHVLLGEADKAEVVKRKVDVWKTKLTTDLKGKAAADKGKPPEPQRAREG